MKSPTKGRPTKFTPATRRRILAAIRDGVPLAHAAALGDISYETFCEWRRRYPEFSDATSRALSQGVATRLRIIRKAADQGDIKAAQWWLEHVVPEHFAKSRMDVSHRHFGKVEHRVGFDGAVLEQIAEARRSYEQGQ